jgi:hypothetical protein
MVCSFHHKLVHEHGWKVELAEDGTTRWFLPDGTRFRAGPSSRAPPNRIRKSFLQHPPDAVGDLSPGQPDG